MKQRRTTALTLAAFEMAPQQRQPAPGLMLPHDRGRQYLSNAFEPALPAAGVRPSLSGTGLANALAGQRSAAPEALGFFATLKPEEVQAKP